MGLLVDGVWHDKWYDTKVSGGRFERPQSQFRSWITVDGSAGPTGEAGFAAEAGRYHLYAAYFCPWAHRTLIFRALKRLEPMIDVSIVNWLMREEGLTFSAGPGIIADPLHNASYLREIYLAADPHYTGRVSVPVLWDKKKGTIVSNESADIIRMFNGAFDSLGAAPGNYRPDDLADEIDRLNARIYDTVNDGVYKAGFATTQQAYEAAVAPLFETLDWLEDRLSRQRYLCGDRLTEADIRLFTTLVRFDAVYVGHFKCNRRRIADYPNLWGFTRDIYQTPGIVETVHFDHIKGHYYQSHLMINPTGIVPVGPDIDFSTPHGRG
jgi:putative glutathione S-transferase